MTNTPKCKHCDDTKVIIPSDGSGTYDCELCDFDCKYCKDSKLVPARDGDGHDNCKYCDPNWVHPKCRNCTFMKKNSYGTEICYALSMTGSIPNPVNKDEWCEDDRIRVNSFTCVEMRSEKEGLYSWCGEPGKGFIRITIKDRIKRFLRMEW